MSSPENVRSREALESFYTPELFVGLAGVIFSKPNKDSAIKLPRNKSAPNGTVKWFADGEYCELTATKMPSHLSDDGSCVEYNGTIYALSTFTSAEKVPISSHSVTAIDGKMNSIESTSNSEELSQSRLAANAIKILEAKAAKISRNVTAQKLQTRIDKSFAQLAGVYVLGSSAQKPYDVVDLRTAGTVIDAHRAEVAQHIESDEYSDINRTHTRKLSGRDDQESTYMSSLGDRQILAAYAFRVAKSLDNGWKM